MYRIRYWLLSFCLLSFSLRAMGQDITVASDGSGDYKTIQEALNSIPTANNSWKTVRIKDGMYDEHVMIKCSFVILVGESRSGTRLEHSISRTDWNNGDGNGSNIGTGVINVAGGMHDIVIANMHIRNTYETKEDYTEVIRTEVGTTRLWVVNCDVLCLYKDTFAAWGKTGGMYYVSDCAFRGSIDAFCPRGWCYALNCRFTETKSSSPFWHEGVSTENQRLVVQGGTVHSEYNKEIKLQNGQNYAQFYYLDPTFSDSITQLGKSATTYFYGVKGKTGLTWFADNLTANERKSMDAAWTYGGNWNPENTFPSVLPFAYMPQPYHGRYLVSSGDLTLKWIKAINCLNQKVYFGTTLHPELVGETSDSVFVLAGLKDSTTYYWKIKTVTEAGETEGRLWCFSTSGKADLSYETAVSTVEASFGTNPFCWVENNVLMSEFPMNVYTLDGKRVVSEVNRIVLTPGFYLVKAGKQTSKIIIP
jgi:hypothetical protein